MTQIATDIDPLAAPPEPFTWRDAGRIVRFGAGVAAAAPEVLSEQGYGDYALLTTARALESAPPGLSAGARSIHHVAPGQVPDAAAALFDAVPAVDLVALGGGRVIDVAKAIGAVRGLRVAAIATTLSGAEMTAIHRFPAGHEPAATIRPGLVIADPELMCGLPEPQLRASAINSLAHGAEALWGRFASPVAAQLGEGGCRLIAAALDPAQGAIDRATLAWGSILAAAALDSGGLGPHHAVCQTLVRVTGSSHAETNAAMLPPMLGAIALAGRHPAEAARIAVAIGAAGADADAFAARLERLAGHRRTLAEAGADPALFEQAIEAMGSRSELSRGPRPFEAPELRALVESAR